MTLKISTIIISLFIFSVSLYSQDEYTDIKEFGLKGNVKSIESKYYSTKENQGKWILDTLNSKSRMDFNENGNITRMFNLSFPELETETTEILRDKNDRKISYQKSNQNGVFETGNYKWVDERVYQIKAIDSFGMRMESEFTLTKDFRDKTGTTVYYDNKSNEYLFTHQYENFFDEKQNLLMSKITYAPIKNSRTIIYKVQETDDFGNWTKVIVYDKENDFRQILIRKIEYYR